MNELRSSDGKYACVIQKTVDGTPTLRVAHANPDGRYVDFCSLQADELFAALTQTGLLPDPPAEEQDGKETAQDSLPF